MSLPEVRLSDGSLFARKGQARPVGAPAGEDLESGPESAPVSDTDTKPALADSSGAGGPAPTAASLRASDLLRRRDRLPELEEIAPGPAEDKQPAARPSNGLWAERPARKPVDENPAKRRRNWLLPAAFAAGVALVGLIAWQAYRLAPTEPDVAETEPAAPVEPGAGAAGEPAPESTAEPMAESTADTATATEADASRPDTATASPDSAPSSGGPAPTVELVRIEPDGQAVIAGRGPPGVEMILLDRGEPIGSVTADPFGEWVFVPEAPLPPGEHVFGLVRKAAEGVVRIPAPDARDTPEEAASGGAMPETAAPGEAGEPPAANPAPDAPDEPAAIEDPGPGEPEPRESNAAPASDADGNAAPIPGRKPERIEDSAARNGGPAADRFAVQLASVKSRAGAEAEWRKLTERFPDLLGPERLGAVKLALDEAEVAGRGKVVRLRIDGFTDKLEARDLCQAFAAQRQPCLVVRTAAGG